MIPFVSLVLTAFLCAVQVITCLPSVSSTNGGRNAGNFDLSGRPIPVNSNIGGACLPQLGVRRHICQAMGQGVLRMSGNEFWKRRKRIAVPRLAKRDVPSMGNMDIPSVLM